MRPESEREAIFALVSAGLSRRRAADQLGIPYGTVAHWFDPLRQATHSARMPHQLTSDCLPCLDGLAPEPYTHLLGLYLGDGHIVEHRRGSLSLSIYCADAHPALMQECELAMADVLGRAPARVARQGCTEIKGYLTRRRCAFPQHGPGMKHERTIMLADWQRALIVLADWQRALIEADPRPLLRGLFHSDGCRVMNRVTVRGQPYVYPRYFFSNASADILAICQWALDIQGVEWRMANHRNLSVAKAPSVAMLDSFIGPKS
jgi:hypothetical protein